MCASVALWPMGDFKFAIVNIKIYFSWVCEFRLRMGRKRPEKLDDTPTIPTVNKRISKPIRKYIGRCSNF